MLYKTSFILACVLGFLNSVVFAEEVASGLVKDSSLTQNGGKAVPAASPIDLKKTTLPTVVLPAAVADFPEEKDNKIKSKAIPVASPATKKVEVKTALPTFMALPNSEFLEQKTRDSSVNNKGNGAGVVARELEFLTSRELEVSTFDPTEVTTDPPGFGTLDPSFEDSVEDSVEDTVEDTEEDSEENSMEETEDEDDDFVGEDDEVFDSDVPTVAPVMDESMYPTTMDDDEEESMYPTMMPNEVPTPTKTSTLPTMVPTSEPTIYVTDEDTEMDSMEEMGDTRLRRRQLFADKWIAELEGKLRLTYSTLRGDSFKTSADITDLEEKTSVYMDVILGTKYSTYLTGSSFTIESHEFQIDGIMKQIELDFEFDATLSKRVSLKEIQNALEMQGLYSDFLERQFDVQAQVEVLPSSPVSKVTKVLVE